MSPEVRVNPRTVSVTSTSPAAAWAQTRAAMLTAEPTYPSSVSAVSPAWTPMPTWMGRSGAFAGCDGRGVHDRQTRSGLRRSRDGKTT